MPDPLAYGVTRLLFVGRDELARAKAGAQAGGPGSTSAPNRDQHPAAAPAARGRYDRRDLGVVGPDLSEKCG